MHHITSIKTGNWWLKISSSFSMPIILATCIISNPSVSFAADPPPTRKEEIEAQQKDATQQVAGDVTTALATIKNGNSIIENSSQTLYGRNNVTLNIDNTAENTSSLSGERLGVFLNGNFAIGDHDKTSNGWGYDYDIQGTAAGIDYRMTDNWSLGTSFGYDYTDSIYRGKRGKLEVDTLNMSIYSSYNLPESFFIDGFFRYGWSDFDLNRKFTIEEENQHVKANYEGDDYSFGINGGYEFVYDAFSFQPFAQLEYSAINIDSYSEKAGSIGTTDSILKINKQHLNSLKTTLGGQANYAISTSFGVFVPTILAEWQHEFKNNSRTVTSSLINNSLANPFSQQTDAPDRDFFNLAAGISAVFAHGFSGFFFYEVLAGNNFISQHEFTVGMRLEF